MTATLESCNYADIIVKGLTQSVTQILSTMALAEVQLDGVTHDVQAHAPSDLSGIMSIIGNNGEGTIVLSMSQALAKSLVARLLGMTEAEISFTDCFDGVGELINMISGSTKTYLSSHGQESFRLSLPNIVVGSNHYIQNRTLDDTNYVRLAFTVNDQPLYIQVIHNMK